MNTAFAIVLVFLGCGTNVLFLELLVGEIPTCGNIVTFAQFLFIAMEGFFLTSKCGTKRNMIPFSTYGIMVLLFIIVSVSNNYAFSFHISMPLHMIFRAGSLIANLVLGVLLMKRSYIFSKYVSVVIITFGISTATIASSNTEEKMHLDENGDIDNDNLYSYSRWLMGILVLTFALFMSALMGIYQEFVYNKYGKHPSESLFYNHALPLPLFLLMWNDITHHITLFNNSAPLVIPLTNLVFPRMWIFLVGNVVTQYVCIRGVFILTTECPSLTVTLVVTLRKFASLLMSIWYFQNPFGTYHWVGTACVFGGTLVFTEAFSKMAALLNGGGEKKKIS